MTPTRPDHDHLPPVVLIHGFATSTERTWREPGWFDLLHDAGRQAVGIDLLGHGDAPKPTNPEAYTDLAGPVMEQMPEGQVDVIGYSLGARIALEIALADPTRVRKMVLAGIGRNVMDQDNTTMAPHVAQRFDALIATAGNDGPALRACMNATRPPFTPAQLSELNVPCLLIMGDQDFTGPPEPLADALPEARITMLPDVDHFGLPKQFAFIDAALEFIDAVPGWA